MGQGKWPQFQLKMRENQACSYPKSLKGFKRPNHDAFAQRYKQLLIIEKLSINHIKLGQI